MPIPEFIYDPLEIIDDLPEDLYKEYMLCSSIKSKSQKKLFSKISYESRKMYVFISIYKLRLARIECKYAFRKGFEAGRKNLENSETEESK